MQRMEMKRFQTKTEKNDKKVTIQFGTRIGGSKNYITLMILNIVGLGISFFYRCQ